MASETDRIHRLQDLDSRHEQLLDELDALNAQIESTLASLRPAEAAPVTSIQATKPRSRTQPRAA